VRGLGVVVDFAGITDAAGELGVFHPNYLRDALRQATVDLMSLVRLVREGDWSEVAGEVPGLEALSFAAEPLSLIGYSLGGIIATQLAAIEPEIGVAVLGVTGGSLMNIVSESPIYNRGYYPLLLPLLGVAHRSIDYENDHPRFMPELAIWQTLLDRGDSIAYARTLSARPISILMPMARHDENLHNVGTESLARALDAQMINDEPLYADVAIAESPLRDNVSVGGEMVTRAVYVWAPATHGLLQDRRGESVWAHPITPPFTAAEDPTRVDNPIDDAMSQIMHFLQSFRTGTAEVSGPR
jgi:pimeloyl-ACP methyl ester carboxylesterase